MIKTFENFKDDPYNEEDWNDYVPEIGDKVRLVNDIVFNTYGTKNDVNLTTNDVLVYVGENEYYEGLGDYKFKWEKDPDIGEFYLFRHEFEPIKNMNESIKELDPYNEEDWNDSINHPIYKYMDVVCRFGNNVKPYYSDNRELLCFTFTLKDREWTIDSENDLLYLCKGKNWVNRQKLQTDDMEHIWALELSLAGAMKKFDEI